MDKIDKNILMKNNELVKARYDLTVVQSRVFIVMLYKLQKDKKGEMSCIISTDEFKQLINRRSDKNLNNIKSILNELMSKRIFFKEIKENNKNYIWGEYNLINGFEYDEELDNFKIVCSQRVYDLLTSYLEIGYTPINLSVYLSLRNSSAQRMYDLLRLWSNSKRIIRYSIDEIKELLMIEKKYKNYSDLKRTILVPAIKALNNTNMFKIEMHEIKKSRRVVAIDFIVEDLDDRVYFKKKEEPKPIKPPKEQPVEPKPEVMDLNTPVPEFCIPDESLLSRGVQVRFKRDFGMEDFTYETNVDAFYDAVAKTLDKDNVDIIDSRSYNYFRQTLRERLKTYIDKEVNDIL